VRRVDGQLVVARLDERTAVQSVRARNLGWVADTLDAEQLAYFLLPTTHDVGHRIGVLEHDRSRVLRALRDAAGSEPWYVRLDDRHHLLSRVPDTVGVVELAVYQVYAWDKAWFRLDHSDAVTIEFWADTSVTPVDLAATTGRAMEVAATEPVWMAPVLNPISPVLQESARTPCLVRIGDRDYRSFDSLQQRFYDAIEFPVDVVYTWVDGADPDWQAQRDEWIARDPRADRRVPTATEAGRFRDNEELRYSLRALHQFVPWARRIYLVTADQTPAWLDTGNSRLRLVSHREILPAEHLPTFNSHAIEARLHHIEGLAEHYLYFNDDVFAGRPLDPSLFFLGNGNTRFFPTRARFIDPGPVSPVDLPIAVAAKNNRTLLRETFGRSFSRTMKHSAHAQSLVLLQELEARYKQQFDVTVASRFRSYDDVSVPTSLHHYYGYVTGRAVPGEIAYGYKTFAHDGFVEWLRRQARRRNDAFCVNDVTGADDDGEANRENARALLARLFPVPSPFEVEA